MLVPFLSVAMLMMKDDRLAHIYYDSEGKELQDHVWDETLKDLSFSDVSNILANL